MVWILLMKRNLNKKKRVAGQANSLQFKEIFMTDISNSTNKPQGFGFVKRDKVNSLAGSLSRKPITEAPKPMTILDSSSRDSSGVVQDIESDGIDWSEVFESSSELHDICNKLSMIKTAKLPKLQEIEDACCELMNQKYSVVYQGGKNVIVWRNKDDDNRDKYEFTSVSVMSTHLSNRQAPYQKQSGEGLTRKKLKIFDSFIEHPLSNRYTGATFSPGVDAPEGYFNLFSGFKLSRHSGVDKCKSLLDHIKDNVCNGKDKYFEYLMGWLADLVQNPSVKPGVAVVLRSDEKGTGKSTIGERFLEHLLGDCYKKVSQPSQLTGKFNNHLSDCLLLLAEESVFCGDKQAVGVLNDLITSNTLSIERKGADIYRMKSCMRLMMITNSEFAAPASKDERRYFVLDVNPQRAQDRAYFGSIIKDLDNGGREQFFNLLMEMDLSNFDVGNAPHTEALRTQIELAMCVEGRFILDVLLSDSMGMYSVDTGFPKADFHKAYVDFYKDHGYGKPLSARAFGRKVKELFGDCVSSDGKINEIIEYQVAAQKPKLVNAYRFTGHDINTVRESFIATNNLNGDIFEQ